MRVAVLGQVELSDAGEVVAISAEKERTVLAALVAAPGRTATVDQLFEELWGESPPATAAKTLQTYVSHLRRHLGDRIVTVPEGYRLDLGLDGLDVDEFERRTAEASLAWVRGDPTVAVERFAAAHACWRGRAFSGVGGGKLVLAEGTRLEEVRVDALENWFECRLATGERTFAVEIEAALEAHPYRERLWGLLMQTLARSGRQADALRAYQRARDRLVEDLGLEPGPDLQAIERAILADQDTPAPGLPPPRLSYATNPDGLQIAYSTVGTGPRTIVFVGEVYMNFELFFDTDNFAPLFERLSGIGQLVAVQRRGTGASDREPDGSFADPADCVGDIDAVLADAGIEGPVSFVGFGHGGQVAVAYAGTRPARVDQLVVVNTFPRLRIDDDYPGGMDDDWIEMWLSLIEAGWGTHRSVAPIAGPIGDDPTFIAQLARLERIICSPRQAADLHRALNDFDVRHFVPAIDCPALVVLCTDSVSGRFGARWLADHLPDGHFAEVPGYYVPSPEAAVDVAEAVGTFLAG